MFYLYALLLHMRFPLDRGIKKPHPQRNPSLKDEDKPAIVLPPCFTRPSRRRASTGTAIPRSNNGNPPPQPYRVFRGSVQSSKAIFRRASRIPLAPSGTRFAVFRAVLSFSSLFACIGFIIALRHLPVKRAKAAAVSNRRGFFLTVRSPQVGSAAPRQARQDIHTCRQTRC